MFDSLAEILVAAAAAIGAIIAGIIILNVIDWDAITVESKKVAKKSNVSEVNATINKIWRDGEYNEVEVGLFGNGLNETMTLRSKNIDGSLRVGQTMRITV